MTGSRSLTTPYLRILREILQIASLHPQDIVHLIDFNLYV